MTVTGNNHRTLLAGSQIKIVRVLINNAVDDNRMLHVAAVVPCISVKTIIAFLFPEKFSIGSIKSVYAVLGVRTA